MEALPQRPPPSSLVDRGAPEPVAILIRESPQQRRGDAGNAHGDHDFNDKHRDRSPPFWPSRLTIRPERLREQQRRAGVV